MVKKATRKRPSSHLLISKNVKFKLSKSTAYGLKIGFAFLLFIFLLLSIKNIYLSVKHSIWDGKSQLMIAYEFNGDIGLIKFDPILHEAAIVNFPKTMLLPLAKGYQSYRIDKIKALAKQENIEFGQLLAASTTQSVGVLTDGYIVNASGKFFKLGGIITKALFHPKTSNLTAWDKLRLWIFVSNLKANEIKQYKAEEEFLQPETLPDESIVMVINENALTSFVLQELANPTFLQEKLTWELYNATQHDGLANTMRRITSNSGFDVTGIRQALEKKSNSVVYVSQWNKVNDNVKRFANFFHFPIVVDSSYTQRSDIALFLGEDYWEKYFTNKE